ncbi:MAG: hypothetical protein AAF750_10070 [Planctomycetota bacterium]
MRIPVIQGGFRQVIPSIPPGHSGKWFTNDHTFIHAHDGRWHCIGINNPDPQDYELLYREHPYLLHASASDPLGPWTHHGFALDDSQDQRYLGAPFVVRHGQRYLMMVEAMWNGRRGLEIATSDDLHHWTRDRQEVITNQPPARRDPCIIRNPNADNWLIYLCIPDEDGHSSITVCTTPDFREYSDPRVVLTLQDHCNWGSLESPFVVIRDGVFFLFFTNSMNHYRETVVIASQTHDRFDWADQITTLHAHAAEVIHDPHADAWYISSCGPEDVKPNCEGGIELARLVWLDAA